MCGATNSRFFEREFCSVGNLLLCYSEVMTETAKSEDQKPTRSRCPTCRREQNCDLIGQTYKPWSYRDNQGNGCDGGITHSLLECRGCNTVFYEKSSWNDNDLDHWYDDEGRIQTEAVQTKETFPRPPSRPMPEWFERLEFEDGQFGKILAEAYKAFDENCLILTSIGLRTALDRGTEKLGIDTALPFYEKLKSLRDGGWIGDTEHDLLDVLTNAGNAAAHRGWSPTDEEVGHLLDVLENFIQRTFINGKRALALRENIPAKHATKP